jgi:hypothetical protein
VVMRIVFPMTLIGVVLVLTGCATPQQQVKHRENLLAAAGFVQHPANTPQRQASLQMLPRDRVMREVHGAQVMYVLADPLVCNCLYIGDQRAWGNYQRERLRLQISSEEAMASEDWEGGAWGP